MRMSAAYERPPFICLWNMTDIERNALFQQPDKGLLKARVT